MRIETKPDQRAKILLRKTIDKHDDSLEWIVEVIKIAKEARLKFEALKKILKRVCNQKKWNRKPISDYLYAYWLSY